MDINKFTFFRFAVVPSGNEEDACSSLECSVSRNIIQGTPVNISFGTPCGPTSQCEQMECVPSETLAVTNSGIN